MTFRSLFGLTFQVHSPSSYELVARDDASDIARVTIVYVPRAWWIDVKMKRGHTIHRGPFASRNEAIALIAYRMERMA